jgi:hypothetical protein
VAIRTPGVGTYSVCTNRRAKALWASSSACGARTISEYEVSSICRARGPRFVTVTRRTSASSSGETTTSIVVSSVPSLRWKCAWSSE